MRLIRSILLVSTLFLFACDSPTSPRYESLRASSDGRQVTLENPNSVPVYYMLANPNFLALADFALCVSPSCPNVPARSTVHVPYSDIGGYDAAETRATLWQWRLIVDVTGNHQQSQFAAIDVPLR